MENEKNGLLSRIKKIWEQVKEEEHKEECGDQEPSVFTDEESNKVHIEYLEQQDGIDSLTGLKGLKVFRHELEDALEIIRGEKENPYEHTPLKELSLIAINPDHFEDLNTTYGHAAGDEALRQIASLLMISVPETDIVARINEREFVVLMKGVSADTAVLHAHEMRVKISHLTFSEYPGLTITASFGVSSSSDTTNPNSLREYADKALYMAKENGRNRVEVYTE